MTERPGGETAGDGAGGHGGHRFPAERRHVLNDAERKRRLPPEAVLGQLGVTSGAMVADIGAGTGFWTRPLSQLVGPTGRVYAVDVEPVMLDDLRALIQSEGLDNVEVVASQETAIPLPDAVADLAVLGFVFHEPADHAAFAREVTRLLRSGGRALVIDWEKRATEKGPPVEHRLARGEARTYLEAAGLRVRHVDFPADEVYILLGTKA